MVSGWGGVGYEDEEIFYVGVTVKGPSVSRPKDLREEAEPGGRESDETMR